MSTITIPTDYAFVGAALVSTVWLNLWQTLRTYPARKSAKIDYPQIYAEKAEVEASHEALVFNCTQRAHHNTLESINSIVIGTAFMGLLYPRTAAGLCATWVVSRVIYTIGYSSGTPKNRGAGSVIASLAALALYSGATWTAIQMVNAAL